MEATTLVHRFEVEKDEMVLTHSFLRVKISTIAMVRKRAYAKTLTSLKKLFDQWVEDEAGKEGVEGKGKRILREKKRSCTIQ